ncbi:MAG: hypothetical protein CM15mP117_24110 [Alphaproteobacteria bacterium]|nr:MAG: hypothetical protein CM15mP117_24110 [Alphaproteobacteria bacterium]
MPIRVPDSLPALDDLAAEGVDLIASGQAFKTGYTATETTFA